MIALILNGVCGDDEFIQQIIGLFNDESDIPDEYKRTEYLKEELLQCRTPLTCSEDDWHDLHRFVTNSMDVIDKN